MIKIISRPKQKIIKCKMCKCKFSYEAEDIQIAQHYRFNHYYDVSIVLCPICKSMYVTNYGDKIYFK